MKIEKVSTRYHLHTGRHLLMSFISHDRTNASLLCDALNNAGAGQVTLDGQSGIISYTLYTLPANTPPAYFTTMEYRCEIILDLVTDLLREPNDDRWRTS